ncbi:MAG: DGQHR domain-containing protein [Chloroflexota bacterium]|nr:DGQHR domain-containing protein [Chloroflexota bacterium]
MGDKGAELNMRVWSLFQRAGFDTMPNSQSDAEERIVLSPGKYRTPDLSATDNNLGVKIIGWNKSVARLRESATVHFHDYDTLKRAAGADTVLFVSTEKEVEASDREYARQLGLTVWGQRELRYHEAVADAIGNWAKYEMIHSLGLTTSEEKEVHTVLGIRFEQPYSGSGMGLFLFTLAPEKLLKTCVIYRRAGGSGDAYQRMVRKARLKAVREFVTAENALLPPSIIVHFGPKVRWDPVPMPQTNAAGAGIHLAKPDYELGVLSIPMEYASLELIDGQHRLYGFVRADPATREKFNLAVLGMLGLEAPVRRDTFVAINANSRRVDPNLVAFLKHTEDEAQCQNDPELMAIKVVVELNKRSPFKEKVRLLDVGPQKITLKGFCGYDLRRLLGKRGLLRKHYPANRSQDYVSALSLYFGLVQTLFPQECGDPNKYIIFTNRGVSAFLKLLRSILVTTSRPLGQDSVMRYMQALRDATTIENWETSKLRNAYVGSKGWKDFHQELICRIREACPELQE